MRTLTLIRSIVILCLFSLSFASTGNAVEWLPIDSADLALKDNPARPGSHAMVLYRNEDLDDTLGSVAVYIRTKIFTDEGKRYADVRIPWYAGHYSAVDGVRGRTIHPDGSIVEFKGEVFQKKQQQTRDFSFQVKTFALPDVTPGSIIEYQYVLHWQVSKPDVVFGNWVYFRNSEWIVQNELFQRQAHFMFKPNAHQRLKHAVRSVLLPANAKMNQRNDGLITLEVENVPPFETEEYMPPEKEIRGRVMFFYGLDDLYDPDKFWKSQSKSWYSDAEEFIGKRQLAERQVASIISSSDSMDTKLRKIYDYVQTLSNYSYGEDRVAPEENRTIEDVIRHKYGTRDELNRLFVAMARAAGANATLVRVPARNGALFHKEWPSFYQLDLEFVQVKNGNEVIYLNPGTMFCPYGTILWEQIGAMGLALDKTGPVFIQIPVPDPSASQTKTVANMKLDPDGTLSGDVEVTLTGQAAIDKRIPALNMDETARKKMMQEVLQEWLAMGADVELSKVNSWEISGPLVATYHVNIPSFATMPTSRTLLRSSLFSGAYRNPFVPTRRIHPIRMNYPYERVDDVKIAIPPGFQVDGLPQPREDKNALAELTSTCKHENGTLHLTRTFRLLGLFVDQPYYSAVRSYFQNVQVTANEPVVLRNTGTPSGK
jgi:hypothetical protein